MYIKWLAVLALGALAACGPRSGGGGTLIPSSLPISPQAEPAATSVPHAPCTPATGLKAPVTGALTVATAYGQLMSDAKGRRYAYPAVDFSYAPRRRIFAAISGVATYYPNLTGFGKALVIRHAGGPQTLYAGFARTTLTLSKGGTARVAAGQQIALSGLLNLRFEYAPAGNVLAAGTQSNPCGSNDTATASIGVMPQTVAVYARFHTLAINGSALPPGPYPVGSPDVYTPQSLTAANVASPSTITATVYEQSDVFSGYYVVLCGNAVFATGAPRAAGPFPYAESQTQIVQAQPAIPPVVFFRDPGKQSALLTQALPAPYGQACPAPPPADMYTFTAPVFNWVGQTRFMYYTANAAQTGDTVTFTSSNTSVAVASPSPLSVYPTAPPAWPPPTNRADLTALAVGTTTITVFDSSCSCNDSSINVTVSATPTPAPLPTPLPNT